MHIEVRPSASIAALTVNSICQRSRDVRSLQQDFESHPPAYFLRSQGKSQARGIVSARVHLAQDYHLKGMLRDAGLELRFAAYCLEISVIRPFRDGHFDLFKQDQLRTLAEAVRLRFSAVREFRQAALHRKEDWRTNYELALELSFLAKTLSFSRGHLPGLNGPKALGLIINTRLEAAGIFHKLDNHNDAFYEYRHLAGLCCSVDDERAARYARRALEELPACSQIIPASYIASLSAMLKYLKPLRTPPPAPSRPR